MSSNEPIDPLRGDERPAGGGGFEYIFVIQSDVFGYDSEYAGGEQPARILTGEATYESRDGTRTEPRRKLYAMGKGWKVVDNGQRIEHEDQKPGMEIFPRHDTNMMLFVRRLSLGLEEGGLGLGDLLRARGGDPRRAGLLKGLKLRIRTEEVSYEFSGETRTRKVELPIEFLGEVGGSGSGGAPMGTPGMATGATDPAAALAAAAAAAQASNGAGAGSLRDKVAKAAQEASSPAEFLNSILATVPDVATDQALLDEVVSGRFWASVRGA